MKQHISHWFRATLLLCICLFSGTVSAQDGINDLIFSTNDSVEISLITCEPHNQIWSLYGHSALHLHYIERGDDDFSDVAVNYGIFDLKKKFFVLRFVFGLTDYKMECEPFRQFANRYKSYGSGIYEQVLDLTHEEKVKLMTLLRENYKPENVTYRYNYFYDNCTTRVRDIIEKCISGSVSYADKGNQKTSFREMIHQWNGDHPWARFGNDMLLGVGADRNTNRAEQEFLPDSLRNDFDKALIIEANGNQRKLVKETRMVVPHMYEKDKGLSFLDTITSPLACFIYLLLLTIGIMFLELKRHKRYWGFDALLLASSGICGVILFCMIFSQHPTVQMNLQILILNPLSLIFLWPSVKALRRHHSHWYLRILVICSILAIVCGLTLQHFADGILILALILLIRYIGTMPMLHRKFNRDKQA